MKRYNCRIIISFVTVSLLLLFGCAAVKPAAKVQSGERAYISYTCYSDDALAVTTDLEAVDQAERKANYFIPPKEPGPALIMTGPQKIQQLGGLHVPADFERAIESYLAQAVVGHRLGQPVALDIEGAPLKNVSDSERYVKLARHARMKLRFVSPLDGAKAYWGDGIRPGETYPNKQSPSLSYLIEDIEDDKVHIKVVFEEGASYDHLFGKIRYVTKNEEYFEQIFDPHVGLVVRSGRLLGRVVEVTKRSFTIDYADPLAGQTLACKVVVESEAGEKENRGIGEGHVASVQGAGND